MKGQLSIEFMLVLAAMLGFISVFAAAYNELEDSSLLALDVKSAKRFSASLEDASQNLLLFGEGSSRGLRCSAIFPWHISDSGVGLFLVVEGEGKNVSVRLPENIVFEKKLFRGKGTCTLTKSSFSLVLN